MSDSTKATIEELIFTTVSDPMWLNVCDYSIKAKAMIDIEKLLDYVAMKEDDAYEQDEVDDIMTFDFNAKDHLGTDGNTLIKLYVSEVALFNWFVEKNDKYCSEHNLCRECRAKLIEDGLGGLECPNGH